MSKTWWRLPEMLIYGHQLETLTYLRGRLTSSVSNNISWRCSGMSVFIDTAVSSRKLLRMQLLLKLLGCADERERQATMSLSHARTTSLDAYRQPNKITLVKTRRTSARTNLRRKRFCRWQFTKTTSIGASVIRVSGTVYHRH